MNTSTKLTTLLITFLFVSCSDGVKEEVAPVPDALDNKVSIPLPSRMYKSSYNIVDELFKEAIDKDENLKQLHIEIENTYEYQNDNTEEFDAFISNNSSYLKSIKQLSNQITDSLLKKNLNSWIENFEANQNTQLENLNLIGEQVNQHRSNLKDLEIILKIVVTEPIMESYLENNKPDISKLESVIKRLEQTSEKVKSKATLAE